VREFIRSGTVEPITSGGRWRGRVA
jgi:hypothetical protein